MHLTRSEWYKILALVLLTVLLVVSLPALLDLYDRAESLLRASPMLGPVLYVLLMIGAILIAPIPASPLAILAGQLFGPWLGMLYTLLAATLGALIAFLLARFFLGDAARNHLKSYVWYKKFNHTDERRIAYVIATTRLMPQISFDLISYAAGLTKIRSSLFVLATFVGMIPIVFIFSFFGAFFQRYQELLLIVLLMLFILYILLRIIRKKIDDQSSNENRLDESNKDHCRVQIAHNPGAHFECLLH